jgi:antitoxin VapB
VGQLNIKDDALIEKLRAMAARRQTSITDTVRRLVAEEEARDAAERQALYDRIMALAKETAAMVPEHLRNSDHSDLYDEHGLPK